ncbi:4113_t:CDS:2 [Dentiscutata heterogama]|uniref:4113_t:CDS:1 n=1 Tax=Dentiscutata heterogama TaxID=1316150 RepID=A0ACA9KRL1_9GLOM|nr:4113_t:CDS:2 [Dentiscutata heterogama]
MQGTYHDILKILEAANQFNLKLKRFNLCKSSMQVSKPLRSCIEEDDNATILKESLDYLFQKIGQRFSIPTIF